MSDDFEYDVAFSFNALDEGIATQLNDLLAPRLKTFIYSERQREIAGTDGQESFSAVYGEKARLVVILYRPEWGETPWTRVERDAIKNRSLSDGWDFTTFVPTVDKPSMPPWLPKTRLYVGLERWGLEGAAAAIEARATERGAAPRQESIIERADRFARASDLKKKQTQFDQSEEGVRAAILSFTKFSERLETVTKEISRRGVAIKYQQSQQYCILTGLIPCSAICEFTPIYANRLEKIYLNIEIHKGIPRLPGFFTLGESRKLRTLRYAYRLVQHDRQAWVAVDEKGREFTAEQLAEHAVGIYIDTAEQTNL